MAVAPLFCIACLAERANKQCMMDMSDMCKQQGQRSRALFDAGSAQCGTAERSTG